MTSILIKMITGAALVGFVHTVLGPDHYLPFVAMSKARKWSMTRTAVITLLCGVGHVASSVLLGTVGIAFGVALFKLKHIESWRGQAAGWMLLAFGVVYFAWGLRRGIRNRPHRHFHAHAGGVVHSHEHVHERDHLHVHDARPSQVSALDAGPSVNHDHAGGDAGAASITPWVLFTIFLFGPCEPLIPFVMYPAAEGHWSHVLWVTLAFGLTTITTMCAIVLAACAGLEAMHLAPLQRYSHAAAGLVILICGAAVTLGL